MTTYIVRRLASGVLVIVFVIVLVFVATRLIGDPTTTMLPLNATEAQRDALRQAYGLNEPILTQFFRFVTDALRGDFGDSLYLKVPALPYAVSKLPATLMLAGATLAVIIPIAVALGVLAARKPNSWLDRSISLGSLGAASVVDFVFAIVLILLFAVQVRVFPTSGYGAPAYFVLPVIALGIRPFGRIIQLTRSAVEEELGKAYVVTARAKGVPERQRHSRHVMRNAILPVVALIGSEAIGLVNGAVVIETIFNWPGIGSLLIKSIQVRDQTMVVAVVFVTGAAVVLLNLLIDVLYVYLNPRIRR